jgi:hypothetical protein
MNQSASHEIVRIMTSTELTAMKVNKDEKRIPSNPSYCYQSCTQSKDNSAVFPIAELCPYWRVASDKAETLSGYCLFLEKGDWEENGTMALFDQLKCCGINDEHKEEELYTKGSFYALMQVHDDMEKAINIKLLENLHWSLSDERIIEELCEPQLDKQFGRAKKVYRRLMKLNNYE